MKTIEREAFVVLHCPDGGTLCVRRKAVAAVYAHPDGPSWVYIDGVCFAITEDPTTIIDELSA